MYTENQEQFVSLIRQRTQEWFHHFPVPAHNFDHANRVAKYAVRIASSEGGNIFLCEVSALLHDIGRVPEKYDKRSETHHELSYELLKQWFREDTLFDILSDQEKKEILYALRYHWCDGADDFDTAIILRDADKLDLLGQQGMERAFEWVQEIGGSIDEHVRGKFYCFYWLRKETSQRIAQEEKLMEPIDVYYKNYLKEKIQGQNIEI